MTNVRTLTVLLMLLPCLSVFGRVRHDQKYRFDIDIPDSCLVNFHSNGTEPYLDAFDEDFYLFLNVYKPKGNNVYSYRHTLKNNDVFASGDGVVVEPPMPWNNLLRHRRTMVQRDEEGGEYMLYLLEFRAKTLFYLRIACVEESYQKAQKILNSFSSNCNTYSYFQIMKSNLRWYQGTFYLSIIPFLALYSSSNRKKWLRSGKNDKKARWKSFWSIVISVLIIVFAIFCLKDCLQLALIVALCSAAVWIVFFMGQTFLKNFIRGFFS